MAVKHTNEFCRAGNENEEPALKTSVLDLFDEQAQSNPQNIAAEFQGQTVTYGQLHDASMRIALELRERGFRPHDRIPLVTSMGLEMIASVLGVLRLGAAYCPIDFKAWSLDRILATLKAVGSHLVFSTVETTLPGYEMVRVPSINMLSQGRLGAVLEATKDLQTIRQEMKHSDLIYVIFTSGTTGKPKGVMVSHGSAAHLVQQNFPGVMKGRPGENVLLFFSVAFDGCAGVIFSTICHGGTLAMAQPSDVINVASSCSTLIVTPSMLASLEPTPEFGCVHSIYMGGEAPTEALVRLWTTPTRKVYNCYGPTECTTAVSTAEMIPGGPIVLGHVVSEVELVLLDENLEHEVEQGEICIRGPCLAVGYLHMEALTQQKFFFKDGIRHYRTGDLARRDKDGLHFVARTDRVVKNRGFLINLEAEVEPALRSFHGVQQAAAFLLQKQLVAFVTPGSLSVERLRKHLVQRSDAFIVPDLLFTIDEFPLTSNGKVDTKALQTLVKAKLDDRLMGDSGESEHEKYPALNVVLEAFAAIFDRPMSQIPSTASFRALGGNSLTAVKLQSRLRCENLSIPLSKLFELDTPAAIAHSIASVTSSATEVSSGDVMESPSTAPLTPHQLELLRETKEDPSSNYNFYCLTRDTTNSTIDARRLREAWEVILTRHAIYRTTFNMDAKTQTVIDSIPDIDWREMKVPDKDEMVAVSERERAALWATLRSQTNPTPILKIHFWIVEVPGEAIQMNWLVHHIYTDAWSFGILLDELELIINGGAARLPPAASYTALSQHLVAESRRQKEDIESLWDSYAEPWKQLRHIRLPRPDMPSTQPWDMCEFDTPLEKSCLDKFAYRSGASSATVIYTAWALILAEYTGSSTVGMKISVSGRNIDHPAADRVVGSLNGRCPLLVKVREDATIEETIASLQSTFFRVNDYQWTYPELRRHLPQESGGEAYWLDSQVVVLLDMPVDTGHWGIFEVQKPTAPVWLGVVQKGDVFNIRLRYDGCRYSRDGIAELGQRFMHRLVRMVESPQDTRISEIGGVAAC
ncbi:nonribosomal peptide synthetase 11 [Colletotrichum cereale]|nr:nonribosomal peptide synthetase 11 [Colletotrichum cereale]